MNRPKCNNPFLSELAGGVHATVGAANLLISYYNWRKGNKKRAVFHLGIAIFEAICFHDHFKEREEQCSNISRPTT